MTLGFHTWVLLGSTFVLSALWAAVLLLLVRLRNDPDGTRTRRGHMAVELAWAVIPALLVLSVVIPTLQTRSGGSGGPDIQVAEAAVSAATH